MKDLFIIQILFLLINESSLGLSFKISVGYLTQVEYFEKYLRRWSIIQVKTC